LRRITAILLLALFGFSPIVPAFASDPDSNLPACCRRDGKHHCTMSGGSAAQDSGPGFTADGRCPLFPGMVLSSGVVSAAALPAAASGDIPRSSFSPHSPVLHSRPRAACLRAHPKRGPPAFSSFA